MPDDSDELGPRQPRPCSWDEVFAITGGLKDVSIEEIERGRADWNYHFSSKDMRPCGRKGCETLHCNGWVVAIKGRRYVNIGSDCAKLYANVDLWDRSLREYRSRQVADAQAAALVRVREQAQEKQYWLDNAAEVERAIWLYESFVAAASGPLLRELERRADKMQTSIERDFKLTEDEIETRRVQLAGSKFYDEPGPYVAPIERRSIGELVGLHCFRWGRAPRLMRNSLQSLVTTLLSWSPKPSDKNAELATLRAMRDLGPYSNDLNESVVATQQFFSDANLRTLMKLDVARSQGMLSVELDESQRTVRIVRKAHWDRAA
jgi:hypothetical protein